MKFTVELHDKYVTLRLQEEKLTTLIAPQLKSELIFLIQKGYRNILLDLEAVRFADSSGLSALLRGNSMCKDVDGIFIIFNVSEHVHKTISISQLHHVLNLLQTEQEAREAVFLHEIEGEIHDESGDDVMGDTDDESGS